MLNFDDLKAMVEINSWTKNKEGVDKHGRLIQSFMTSLGFKSEVYKRESVGNHLLFFTPVKSDKPRLLLLGHLDTVFPPGTFELFSQDEEWVYGPGVCDMKGGNFVAIEALRSLVNDGISITNIDFLLVSDEETGSDDSRYLTKSIANNYDACIDFEAAGVNHEVVIGRKGVATYQVQLTGKAAHAGNHYTSGADANLAAARMLIALNSLTDLNQGTTVNVGKMEGGIGANTISPNANLLVEARFTTSHEQEKILRSIEEIALNPKVEGVEATLSGGLQRDVMIPSPAQKALLNAFEQAIGYPLATESRGGVSDANLVSGAGVATLDGFGPFGDGDHTVKERASIASFERRINEVSKVLRLYTC
ncbi:M20 family metallopeptidase [Grimontia kaedaensis]|uniref:M20 family metallopeptidase n=1 Tax=Grimontia kaedaensis TaxID=2872157 RepID=A0ABY4WY79_9GAMM|nr:M20 family metallopeptidase [Grimontia kaedaensis]USH03929.1 M20 family metallopeptidase [Grimontia kaedaensis]